MFSRRASPHRPNRIRSSHRRGGVRCHSLEFAASSAGAGANPDVRAYIEFQNDTNYIEPVFYEAFTATINLANLEPGEGITGVAFKLNRTFDAMIVGETHFGLLAIGDSESGWQIVRGECEYPDSNGRIAVAEVDYVYFGPGGTLSLAPHDDDSTAVVDCSSLPPYDYLCVRSDPSGHAGVWATPPAGNCQASEQDIHVPGDDSGGDRSRVERGHGDRGGRDLLRVQHLDEVRGLPPGRDR